MYVTFDFSNVIFDLNTNTITTNSNTNHLFTGLTKNVCSLYNNFNIPNNSETNEKLKGFIVRSKGTYIDTLNSTEISIDNATPFVEFTQDTQDKACFGVL